MKWIPNKTFPHPVLSTATAPPDRDYVNRAFQATSVLEITPADQTARLSMSYALSEESLVALVKDGKAKYATEIHCRETFLRRLLISGEPAHSADFTKGELHRRVEVSSYVVCADVVHGHVSDNYHPEFGKGARFDFNRGDVLAADYPSVYWVEPNPQQAIGTIFDLRTIEKNKGLFSVNLDCDNIEIVMHEDDAKKFHALQNDSDQWPSLLASVYLSALCEALRVATAPSDDSYSYGDKKWFGVVAQELSNNGFEMNPSLDILKAAQTLLDYPAQAMMTGEAAR